MTEHKSITQWREFAEQMPEFMQCMTYTYDNAKLFQEEFSPIVIAHIAHYVLPTYGTQIDAGNDAVSLAEDKIGYCTSCIKKYRDRKDSPTRINEKGVDCLKRAHYAQIRATMRGNITLDDVRDAWEAFIDWKEIGR